MEIKLYQDLNQEQKSQVLEIYKLTTSSADKDIKYKYFDYYLENSSEFFLVAVDDRVEGYVCGQNSTLDHYDLLDLHTYLDLFRSDIEKFPAHLHINVHPRAQGKGVGSKLMTSFENLLKTKDTTGVHIVTLDGEENMSFYTARGFDHQSKLEFQGKTLVLMGKLLK